MQNKLLPKNDSIIDFFLDLKYFSQHPVISRDVVRTLSKITEEVFCEND